ncbi:MAG: M50 family metallopeptidase [Desulfovibrionaceae bacterium]|nr:M50 family metallopeptidase [Desulfovibrionaceae bacterium]
MISTFFGSLPGTIAVLLVFGGLIFFHELGHFLVARFFKMGVKTFSLGFGPAILSRKRGKTVYQIAAIPLGGFVSLVGETPSAEVPGEFSTEENFSLRPAWQRFCVIAAGSIFNLMLAWIICWGLVWVNGRTTIPPVVGEILPHSAAHESPLQIGDTIISLNGIGISRFMDMPPIVQASAGEDITVVARQPDESLITFTIKPTLLSQTTTDGHSVEAWSIGIRPGESTRETFGFIASAWEGMIEAKNMAIFIWKALGDLVSRKVAFDNVGGPILIAQVIYQQADHGLISVLMLAALISVNLGVLNLLPIPVLDGGHLLFLLVEMATGRQIPAKVQEKAMLVGLFLLLALMLAATFNDVMRIFG